MSTPSLNLSKIEPIFEGVEPDNSIGETNPRWTAVENYVVPHLQPSSRPYHVALEHAVQNSRARGLKDIAVAASQGKFLAVQCQLLGAKHILEVGTLGAYSAIWMASAGPDVHVTTIEIDGAIAAIARENIKFAGFEDRIQVIVGDALDLLPKLMKKFSKVKESDGIYRSSMQINRVLCRTSTSRSKGRLAKGRLLKHAS